jgi:hypothetical protein
LKLSVCLIFIDFPVLTVISALIDEDAGESSRTFQPYVQALLAIRDEFRSIQSDLEFTRESLAQAQAKAGHALNLVEQLVSRMEARPENQERQGGVNFYHDDVSDLR